MDFDEAVLKKRDNYITILFIQSRRFGGSFPPSTGPHRNPLNSLISLSPKIILQLY